MASKLKVDQLAGSAGSTITVPTGQTLTVTDGIAATSLQTVTAAKGGTGQVSYAAGDILYASGSTAVSKLAKGTASQQLTMNAGATAPEWTTSAAGQLIKISSGSISTASQTMVWDNIFNSSDGYVRYILTIDNLYGDNNGKIRCRYRIYDGDNSNTFTDDDYRYSGVWHGPKWYADAANPQTLNITDSSGSGWGYAQRDRITLNTSYDPESSGYGMQRDIEFGGHNTGSQYVYWLRDDVSQANFWKFEFLDPTNRNNHAKVCNYEITGNHTGRISNGTNSIWENYANTTSKRRSHVITREIGWFDRYSDDLSSIMNIKGFELYCESSSHDFEGGDWVLYGLKK
jgi:hypothetical protein